jgi:hypothetical protein
MPIQFYRKPNDKNLYEVGSNRVIGATEFGIGTPNAGQGFQEIAAPVEPSLETAEDPLKTMAKYAGGAGLGLSDLTKIATDTSAPTKEQQDKIKSDLGIADLENKVFAMPSQNTEQLYGAKYSELGLSDLKSKIADLENQINVKKNALNEAIGKVSENPWLDEASRVGRVKRLTELANADISNISGQYENMRDLYSSGIDEINNYVIRSSTDFNNEKANNASKLDYLLKKAEEQIKSTQTENASKVYRYIPDYLQAYQSADNANVSNKLLSPTEAATLGVPYGTTEAQAAALGITPERWKEAAAGSSGSSGGGGGSETFVSGNISPEQQKTLSKLGLAPHQQELVVGIIKGISPPINPSNPRTVELQKTLGGLAALGYDNSKAWQDWTEMQKRINTLSSTSFVRLENSIRALDGSTEQAERLYAEWQQTGLPSGFSTFNKAALEVSARLPGQAGVAARTLLSHIEDMSNELSVVYRLGNTPTDKALESAAKSLQADWNSGQFAKNLELIRQNMKIRLNSLSQSSYLPENIYTRPEGELLDIFENDNFQSTPSVAESQQGFWSKIGGWLFGD